MNKVPVITPVDKKQYLVAALLVFAGAVFISSKAVMVKLAYRYEIDSVSTWSLPTARNARGVLGGVS
jgi:hypothetical protein